MFALDKLNRFDFDINSALKGKWKSKTKKNDAWLSVNEVDKVNMLIPLVIRCLREENTSELWDVYQIDTLLENLGCPNEIRKNNLDYSKLVLQIDYQE